MNTTVSITAGERLLNIKELAYRLNVSRRTIERRLNLNQFPRPIIVGGMARWSWDDVIKNLREERPE